MGFKTKKKIIISAMIGLLCTVLVGASIFAWFTTPQKSTVIKTSGNVNIDVDGYIFKYTKGIDGPDVLEEKYPIKFDEDKVDEDGEYKAISGLDLENYVQFGFVIRNTGDTKCDLSLRFSNYSNYLFSYFNEYVDGIDISDELTDMALNYNAKFTLCFDDIYYINGTDIVEVDKTYEKVNTDPTLYTHIEADQKGKFLWRYANSEKFVNDSITVLAGESVTLYFSIITSQNSESIDDYRKWVEGPNGQNYLALTNYNKPYADLTTEEKNKIDSYLSLLSNTEIDTIVMKDNQMPDTNLLFDYIEIIASGDFRI